MIPTETVTRLDTGWDETELWLAWESVIEGICAAEHADGEVHQLRIIETRYFKELERWGYCDACGTCWRANSGGVRADGTVYGRSLDTMVGWQPPA